MSQNNFHNRQNVKIEQMLNKLHYYYENFYEFGSVRRFQQLTIALQVITLLVYVYISSSVKQGIYGYFFFAMATVQAIILTSDLLLYMRYRFVYNRYEHITRNVSYITLTKGVFKFLLGSPASGFSDILLWRTLNDQWSAIGKKNAHEEIFHSFLTSSLITYYGLLLLLTFIPIKMSFVTVYYSVLLFYSISGEIYVLLMQGGDTKRLTSLNFSDYTYLNFYLILLFVIRITNTWFYHIWSDILIVFLGVFGVFDFLFKNYYDEFVGLNTFGYYRIAFSFSGIALSLFYLGMFKITNILVNLYGTWKLIMPAFDTPPLTLSAFLVLLFIISFGYLLISHFINDEFVFTNENNKDDFALKYESPLSGIKDIKNHFESMYDYISKLEKSIEAERQSIEHRLQEEIFKHKKEWYQAGVEEGQLNANSHKNWQKESRAMFFSNIPSEIRKSCLVNYATFLHTSYNGEHGGDTLEWINSEIGNVNEMLKNKKGKKP